jgi:hypothetical protein
VTCHHRNQAKICLPHVRAVYLSGATWEQDSRDKGKVTWNADIFSTGRTRFFSFPFIFTRLLTVQELLIHVLPKVH